jgi:hypothetical protein
LFDTLNGSLKKGGSIPLQCRRVHWNVDHHGLIGSLCRSEEGLRLLPFLLTVIQNLHLRGVFNLPRIPSGISERLQFFTTALQGFLARAGTQ